MFKLVVQLGTTVLVIYELINQELASRLRLISIGVSDGS